MAAVCFIAQRNFAVINVAKEDWNKEMNIDYFEEIQYSYLGLVERTD